MIDVSRDIRIGGVLYKAAHGVMIAIDAVAKNLTGSDTYFHIGSSTATEAELAHKEKLRRIEAGEEPWPR